MWEEMTVDGFESSWILLRIESIDFQNIPLVSCAFRVAERYLLVKGVLVEELHRLQMRMKLLDHRQLLLQKVLDDISHGYVIG